MNIAEIASVTSIRDGQAVLNALPGSHSNLFTDDSWSFVLPDGSITTVDFSCFSKIQIGQSTELKKLEIDIPVVSRFLWLNSLTPQSLRYGRQKAAGIALFWNALVEYNISTVSTEFFPDLISYFLTRRWENSQVILRRGITSYVNYSFLFPVDSWRATFNVLGIPLIPPNITSDKALKLLKAVIPELTDDELTYADWIIGKSYNLLTLDHGQYYVEHCLTTFNQRIALATAVASTIRAIPEIAKKCNLNQDHAQRWTLQFLSGRLPSDITDISNEDGKPSNHARRIKTFTRVYESVLRHFRSVYSAASFKSTMMKEAPISTVLRRLGVQPTHEQIDRFRLIIWTWLHSGNVNGTTALLDSSQPRINFSSFVNEINRAAEFCADPDIFLPNEPTYNAMGLRQPPDSKYNTWYPRELVKLVECAGLTSVVALTGWRRSEFGFPISAIKCFPNEDLLDQYAFPFRYQVEWYVAKTNRQVPEKREITFSIAVMAQRLQALLGVSDDEPCLYKPLSSKRNKFEPGRNIARAVECVWPHFVENYPPYKALADLETWDKLSVKPLNLFDENDLNDYYRLKLVRLLKKPDDFRPDPLLKSAWIKARSDLEILKFYFIPNNNVSKVNWAFRYRERTLDPAWMQLLDQGLSESTREWIRTIDIEEFRSSLTTKTLSAELVSNCLHPTPHAFRHMWAEAVYRRFDGDVGWMIRSHFKHISKRMWLAYVRDKDNRLDHTQAKSRVINSIVANYFSRQGVGYAGQMDKWLRRLGRQTTIMSPQEQQQFVNRIAAVEISDIKANAFGYCLLKKRSAHIAKCSLNGEPQRHNASPDLCLECAHNLMQKTNLDWLLLHAATHLEALRNPIVPKVFKVSSISLLKKILMHLRRFDPAHAALAEISSTLREFAP